VGESILFNRVHGRDERLRNNLPTKQTLIAVGRVKPTEQIPINHFQIKQAKQPVERIERKILL
jgi:predicted pyridoxine 5'-phosphate oxidase superfamily flavin-nucleotide-binding protein